MHTITQFIGPWIDGQRTTMQFFSASRSLWIIAKDNSGHQLSRSEMDLGSQFELALASANKLVKSGWEKWESEVAS